MNKINKVSHPRASEASELKFLGVFEGKPVFKTEIIDKINQVHQPRASGKFLGCFIKKIVKTGKMEKI